MNTFGRLLMSLAIGIYAFIPPFADLATDTHVFHNDWVPHARMHTVWLLGVSSSLGLVTLYFLWLRKDEPLFNINIAALLSLCVYGPFFLSTLTARLYGGELTDAVGGVEDHLFGFDINLIVFSLATLLLGLGWGLCKRASAVLNRSAQFPAEIAKHKQPIAIHKTVNTTR